MDPLGRERAPDIARVEAQLAKMWRGASDADHPVTRASTLNLIVVCSDEPGELQAVTDLVARVAETEPGRTQVVCFPAAGAGAGVADEGVEAFVSSHCHLGPGGKQICSEQITLESRGSGHDLLPATLLQLLEGGLPIYTFWRRDLREHEALARALLEISDRFIVNSGERRDPARALAGLAEIVDDADRAQAADLTWERLECWREALASFFDGPLLRPGLERISELLLVGGGPAAPGKPTAAAAYLAGWLASRLGWSRDASGTWRRGDGAEVAISFAAATELPAGDLGAAEIRTELPGTTARLVAQRTDPAADIVRLSVECAGSCPLPWKIQLPARDDAALLCGLLQRSRSDPLFQAALEGAARF
jgi:glucose-6-phosphate dehydrogenase assembly protein OpcA